MPFRDLRDAFEEGFKTGPTEIGAWGERERFGRLQGVGEVSGEIELPAGEIVVSIEDYPIVRALQLELTGPDGSPISLERYGRNTEKGSNRGHVINVVAHGRIGTAGLHQLVARAQEDDTPLLICLGRNPSAADILEEFPGGKLLRRLRKGSSP
jgi:hypothetical protein